LKGPEKFKIPSPIFGKGIYYTWDYAFYDYKLRRNAREREDSYLTKYEEFEKVFFND